MQGYVSFQFSVDVAVPVARTHLPKINLTMNRAVVADHGIASARFLADRPTSAELCADLAGNTLFSDCNPLFGYPLYRPFRTVEET